MSNPVWTIRTSAGVEKSLAAWGLSRMQINRVDAGQDKATFRQTAQAFDGAALFDDFDTAIVYRTDPVTGAKVSWFSGIWTKTPRNAMTSSESIAYELSGGPWWYLSHCMIQTYWQAASAPGGSLGPILKALNIIGLDPSLEENLKIDLFSYLSVALNYCLTAGANQTTPVTPFLIGEISETDFIVPWEQLKNCSCADLIQHCLRWIPDARMWVDYSTIGTEEALLAPTINIVQRSALTSVSLPARGGIVSAIKELTPRTDLLVSAVICKYDETNTIDGTPIPLIGEDKYPPGANEYDFHALVSSVDLQGGSENFEKVPVTVSDRPVSVDDEDALEWVKKKYPWIWAQTVPGTYDYDVDNITLVGLDQSINPSDPQAGDPPNLSVLTEEWLTGQMKDWMGPSYGLYDVICARTDIKITLGYSGTDATTIAKVFSNSITAKQRVEYITITATNAQSQTYVRLTSLNPSEPLPTGLAQNIYNANSVLQYEGAIELHEKECSGTVKLGNVLNLTGSLAAWATMNAQVVGITEEIGTGTTTVRLGPSKTLDLNGKMDLIRAARWRVPAYSLAQRTSGDASTSEVKGHTHTTHESRTTPGGGGGVVADGPFLVTLRVAPGSAPGAAPNQMMVSASSTLLRTATPGDKQTISNLGVWLPYVDGADFIYLEVTIDSTDPTNPGTSSAATIASYGSGGAWNYNDPPQESGAGSGAYEYDLTTDSSGNKNFTCTKARIAIFQTYYGTDGKAVHDQKLTGNLILNPTVYAGPTADGQANFGVTGLAVGGGGYT